MSIPLDDAALDQIEHALGAALSYEAEDGSRLGEPRLVGADMSLPQLLDFWAGIDPNDDGVLIGHAEDFQWAQFADPGTPVYDCSDQPTFSERDLIRALVTEVRALRGAT